MAKLNEFFNKVSNNNRIFTAEDIGEMSGDEFLQNEKAVDYQMENLGIPRRNDLNGNSDVIFVHSYTRNDGTNVKSHYRSRNGGSITGAAADIEQSTILEGGITYNDYPINENPTVGDYFKHQVNSKKGSLNKKIVNRGINYFGPKLKQNVAVELWNIASDSEGIYNNDYINKNGALYNDVDSLSNEYAPYKSQIKEKINSQFGNVNVPGVVLHENSNVANAIANSPEMDNFIRNNSTDLKSGKEVSGSFRFSGFTDLHNAFGSVDVLSAKPQGDYVDITLLDTYDFNQNDPNILVKMGRSAQETGKLNPYFTIVKCRYKLK